MEIIEDLKSYQEDPASWINVPKCLRFERHGKFAKNRYALTVTMNVKHKDYQVITCPDKFRNLFNSELDRMGVKHYLSGIYELHKSDGVFRMGGIHLHGIYYYNNPPKNNKYNLFNFQLSRIVDHQLEAWLMYCKKDMADTWQELIEM